MKPIPLLLLLLASIPLTAQWAPGSVYREYVWRTPTDHHEAFLRVGGRYGYAADPGKLPAHLQDGLDLILPDTLDLTGATAVEVVIEKVLSHEDSRNLRIAINGYPAISVPEPTWIPEPQTEYMYHTDLTIPVPLNQLKANQPNRFRLSLDDKQRWNWPQNVIYGLTFRVYYSNTSNTPEVIVPALEISEQCYLHANAAPGSQSVDYILIGKNIDWSGRGHLERKHWQTHRGEPLHIIGSSTAAASGYAVKWDTEWLPDQESFAVQARVLGADGKYRVGTVSEKLILAPRPYRVTAYVPGPAPRNWVTRSGEFEQALFVTDSVQTATAYRLNWTSWSPCYANGLYLNGHLVWSRNEDCYVFATHSPEFSGHALPYLQSGENNISTGLTPLMRGKMVHGMEVQWPGVQLLVRYRKERE